MSEVWRAAKAALFQIHSIIGLALMLALTVIALTGVIMSFEDEIQASLNADLTRVEPRSAHALTPDELVARVGRANAGRVSSVTMASDPAAAVRVRFAVAKDGARSPSVYADPYDGSILGSARGEAFFITVRKLHRWLLIPGDGNGHGRTITGITTICLIVMLISGIVLRWPRRAGSLKAWLKPGLALRGRGLYRSLHAVVGTWVLPIYLVIALTGLWFSFDWYKSGVRALLARPAPAAAAPVQSGSPQGAAMEGKITFDRAWSTFLREQGDRFAIVQLILPRKGTAIWIRSWSHDSSVEGMRDEFRIDAFSGQVVSSDIYADKTFGERIIANVLDIHRGSILGWPGKLLFMLAASLMPLFGFTGLLLYLSRRKHRRMSQQALAGLSG
jgi:sulfite reductase (NADPH) flavoprotein alpha-component